MMYKIDWEKYLSCDRYRVSQFEKRKKDGNGEFRSAFESDYGRVIFSSAIRRMHDKTQVMPLSTGDSVHTRLTHSLEVMSIAYSLGIALCRDIDFLETYGDNAFQYERDISIILKTAALVHDIGNPPFGHFGETIIQNYFKKYLEKRRITDEQALDFICFDGNAQGFRILTRLQYLGDLAGLNLTYATLAAYTKYPNNGKIDEKYIGRKKHGVFTSENEILQEMADKCNLKNDDGSYKRHPLSFLVEAADTISYNIMDIEDGLSMGWYRFDDIVNFIKNEYGDKYENLNKQLNIDQIQQKYYNNESHEFDEKGQMSALRVSIIFRQVNKAIKTFKENLQAIDEGTYSKELLDDGDELSKVLGKFATKYIFPNKQIELIELTGHSVITGLLDKLLFYAFDADKKIRNRFKSVISDSAIRVVMHTKDNEIKQQDYKYYPKNDILLFDFGDVDEYLRLRAVVDFVSGMTDKYAVSLYQKLSGLKL